MPTTDGGINFKDEELNIDWLVDINELIISEKDRVLPRLAEIEKELQF
jgi:dTDP-4-dehydrorhamnose 3,5-epimerase